jgi:hypothetical protein
VTTTLPSVAGMKNVWLIGTTAVLSGASPSAYGLWTSTDLATWNSVSWGHLDCNAVLGSTWFSYTSGQVDYTTDFINFTTTIPSGRYPSSISPFTQDASKIVALGSSLYFFGSGTGTVTCSTSTDGLVYTAGTVSNLPVVTSLVWKFLVLGSFIYALPDVSYSATDTALQTVYKSSDGVTWTAVSASPWGIARTAYGYVAANSKVYILGGDDTSGTSTNTVYSSSDLITWTNETYSFTWSARTEPGAIYLGGKIYVLGGSGSLTDVYYIASSSYTSVAL